MKKTTNKKIAIVKSVPAVCALVAVLCFTGCGKSNNSSKTETTTVPAMVTATIATPRTVAPTRVQKSVDNKEIGSSTQISEASDKQKAQADQQKATYKACEAAANLYGDGNWGVASIETQTSDAGTAMYYIGVINHADSQSPTYYFYVDGENCSPDNSANEQIPASVSQEEKANKMKAVQSAVEMAEKLCGEGNWGVASIETQTSDAGTAMYYIGVINHSNSQSPIYYFYVDGENCSPDNSANGQIPASVR